MQQLLVIFLIASSLIYSKIIEMPYFSNLYQHVSKDSIIILDIDDTLLVPKQMLGCDEWFQYRVELHKKIGSTSRDAVEKALAEWEAIRHLSQMELVEEECRDIIYDLQKQGFIVMGLSTQGLALATRTNLQLAELGINLATTAPSLEDIYFTNHHHGVLFRGGILFTSGTSKADSLEKFCQRANLNPKKILFLNDKETHLKDVEQYTLRKGIEFIGLRYSFSDKRKSCFSKEIADYQFSYSSFSKILSDQETIEQLYPKRNS